MAGRAVNYLSPAKAGERSWDVEVERLREVFEQLAGTRPARGWVRLLVGIANVFGRVGIHSLWLPDVITFLDVTPECALDRIHARGEKVDPHENKTDLARARGMYLRTLDAVTALRGKSDVVRLPVDEQTISGVINQALVPLIVRFEGTNDMGIQATLGRTENGGAAWKQFLSPSYLIRCLTVRFFNGTWREPLFPLSSLGRHFMEEGYSASVMQDIYDQDVKPPSILDRPYVGYPLHRAVYDRLHLLVPRISTELINREGPIRIFTAPSGMAEDVFLSVERAAASRPGGTEGIEVTALDLNPNGDVGAHLRNRSVELGVDLNFVRGDMTAPSIKNKTEGPFDIAIFVGLSSWLPRPQLLDHLCRLRRNLSDDGVLLTDVFTPGAYALSGWHGGYRASYYGPKMFSTLLELSGFDANSVTVSSGRDGLNHVMVCRPKVLTPKRVEEETEVTFSFDPFDYDDAEIGVGAEMFAFGALK